MTLRFLAAGVRAAVPYMHSALSAQAAGVLTSAQDACQRAEPARTRMHAACRPPVRTGSFQGPHTQAPRWVVAAAHAGLACEVARKLHAQLLSQAGHRLACLPVALQRLTWLGSGQSEPTRCLTPA